MRWSIGVALAIFVGVGAMRVDAQKPQGTAKSAASASHIKVIATAGEIMQLFTIPLSNAVFEAGGDAPSDDKSWETLRGRAVALAESGNLLMLGSRAKDRAAWMTGGRRRSGGQGRRGQERRGQERRPALSGRGRALRDVRGLP